MTAAPGLLDAPLDPELLRGVPLKVCLQGIGKHWKRSIAASDSSSLTVENSYGLSQKTARIDFFFSHDWETSRLLKWLSLLVMFNSHAAATAMMLVTTCLVVLAAMGGLPMVLWPWLPVFSMLSYAVMFLFWQRFRSFCGKPLLVFLDRLCIAQHDMALKEQGIRGLGSFLEKSQNLTILWSGRYFSRLWCLYEVASYLKDERSEHKNIQILPVHLCLLLCIASAQATSWMFAIHLAVGTMGVDGWWIIENPVLFNLFGRGGAAFIPVALYVGLGCMTRLYQLPRQLQNFRVQDAQCFCCSNGHQHPETGKELPCDRRLVFSALEKWFSRDDDVDGDWMERFNRMVREKLSSRIAHTVGRGLPPFKYVLSTVCVAPVPYIGFFIVVSFMGLEDEEIDGHDLDKEDDMVFFVLAELMEFLLPPLYGVFCLLLIIQVCRLVFYFFQKLGISTSVLAHPCRRALLALLISPMLWAVLVFGIWVPMIGEFSDGGELLPEVKGILYLLYCALVGAFFFLPELDCSQPGVSTNGGTWRDPGTILGSGEIPSISGTALKPGVDSAMGEDLCREIEEELMSVRF